jgi:hypothetical protein
VTGNFPVFIPSRANIFIINLTIKLFESRVSLNRIGWQQTHLEMIFLQKGFIIFLGSGIEDLDFAGLRILTWIFSSPSGGVWGNLTACSTR